MAGKWKPFKMQIAGQTVYRVQRICGETEEAVPVIQYKGPVWETQEEAARFAAKLNEEE